LDAVSELRLVAEESGLVPAGSSGVALVSGGADSACTAAALVASVGADSVVALTCNYGLRETADRDERVCRDLCEKLGIELVVERPKLPPGNLQAAARDARYAAAERLRAARGLDWIATGHTRSDQVETLLYRLAVSPGRRGLLGLPPRRGRVIRPLVTLERTRVRELALAAELPFADDETNLDPDFARNRIRAEAIPALLELSPAAERNIAETRAELAEEAELLERVVRDALQDAGLSPTTTSLPVDALQAMEPALRRLVMRTVAEHVVVREIALPRWRAEEILRLALEPEGGKVDLGGGLRAVCEQGFITFSVREPESAPPPAVLPVPGNCRFGRWEMVAEVLPGPLIPTGPERATLDGRALGHEVVVRGWQDGDRMRPLGMEGTKSLQDLFTDRHVPRSLRRSLPIVLAHGRIAWVAGVAVSEEFKLTPDTVEVAILSASLAGWHGRLPG
jgi:tRNA(Ile)-lysidine synthase